MNQIEGAGVTSQSVASTQSKAAAAEFYRQAFSRNLGLISADQQEIIRSTRIGIPGMGGVGGVHLITLLRLGVSNFTIADQDTFDIANFNRQYGAKMDSVGKSKVHWMAGEARQINPDADIRIFPDFVTQDNVDDFLEGVDIVLDSIDFFQLKARRLVFNKARDKGIHVVTAGPMGLSSALLVFAPDGMSFDRYFNIDDSMTETEMVYQFALGLTPKATHFQYMDLARISMEHQKGPSLGLACQLCAAAAAAEVVRIVLQPQKVKPAPHYFQYDLWTRNFVRGYLPMGNGHPMQRFKIMMFKRRLGAGPAPRQDEALSRYSPDMQSIIQAGLLAPSGDNVQPWKFGIGLNSIDIYLDRAADRSAFNVCQLASLISCGAVMENMRIQALALGLEPSIHLHDAPDEGQMARVGTISLAPGARSPGQDLSAQIPRRHTNRTKYDGIAAPKEHLDMLRASIADIPRVSMILVEDQAEKLKIANMVHDADIVRSANQELHEYLMKMIRFDDEEMWSKRDGFHIKNLSAGTGGELFLKFSRPWKRMKQLNKLGMGRVIAKVSRDGIRSSSAVGLIKSQGRSMQDFINGGRAMQRIWLTATKLGLDFQPMTAITLFWMSFQLKQMGVFDESQQALLQRVWKDYDAFFDTNETEGHVMLFRIGHGKPLKTRTIRKKLEDILLD